MNEEMLQKAIGEMSEAEKRDAILLAPSRRLPKTMEVLRRVANRWREMRKAEGNMGPASDGVVMCAEDAYKAMLEAEKSLGAFLEKYPEMKETAQ